MFITVLFISLAVHSSTEEHEKKQESGSKESGPHVKRSRLSAEELAADVSWKKLSSSSKMRNYRDGKYRDSELLYKERPPRSSGDAKGSSHREDAERVSKSDLHRSERKCDEKRDRKDELKSSSSSRRSRNEQTSSRRRSASRSRDVLKSSSSWTRKSSPANESRGTSSKNYKQSRHHERGEEAAAGKAEGKEQDRSHRHRHHRHHHHRHHHHSTSKSDREKSLPKSAAESTSISKSTELKSAKSSSTSTYQAYPVIKSFDSKQIYSDGIQIFFLVLSYFNNWFSLLSF